MANLCLHIGLPKTGTTALQQAVFPRLGGILALTRQDIGRKTAGSRLLRTLSNYLAENGLELAARNGGSLYQMGYAHILLSNELISLNPENDPAGWRFYAHPAPEQVAVNAKRMADDLACDVSVLVTLRRQDTWLASRFAESGKYRGQLGQAAFEYYISQVLATGMDAPLIRWLNYGYLAHMLQATFGCGQVMFLPMEQLAAEPAASRQAVARFVTGDPAAEDPAGDGEAAANARSVGPDQWQVGGRQTTNITLSPERSGSVLARFAQYNRLFTERTGLSLEPYGYFDG